MATIMMRNTISPYDEMVAFEALWSLNDSQKKVAELFKNIDALPSKILESQNFMFANEALSEIESSLKAKLGKFSVSIHRAFQYPRRLREAKDPVDFFYYRGDLGLLESPCISVVGTRKSSETGRKRTRKLVKGLIKEGYTIISGLARGIDTVAHAQSIKSGGRTIAAIGTPIDRYYPAENRELQEKIATEHLLISQVPFYRYEKENIYFRRLFFPQRDVTMAALAKATIIVEASDTSGTLIQARECLRLGRPLFVLDSCFKNPKITWPRTYEKRGAIRVKNFEDILKNLD